MTEANGSRVRVPNKGICTILSYEGNGFFTVLTSRDQKLLVPRNRMTFIKKRSN